MMLRTCRVCFVYLIVRQAILIYSLSFLVLCTRDEAKMSLVPGVAQKHKKFKTLKEAEEFIAQHRRDNYKQFSPPSLKTAKRAVEQSTSVPGQLEFSLGQSMSPLSPLSPDFDQSVLNSEPREFRPEYATSNLVASPSCDVVFDSESEPDSNPELVRFVVSYNSFLSYCATAIGCRSGKYAIEPDQN